MRRPDNRLAIWVQQSLFPRLLRYRSVVCRLHGEQRKNQVERIQTRIGV